MRFMESVIDSLRWARTAAGRVHPDDATGPLLVALHHRRDDYRCAAKRLEPFAHGGDRIIAQAAQILAENYDLLGLLNDRTISTVASAVNAPGLGPGDLLDRLATLRSQMDEVEFSLLAAVAVSTYALVQWGPQGEATGWLNITGAERQRLLGLLRDSFGAGVASPRAERPGERDVWESAGHMIYAVLTDPHWKSS